MTPQKRERASVFFGFIVRNPWQCLLPLLLLLLLSLQGLSTLTKDTRSDAFLAADNPALLYRDLIREQFGLADPMLVALVADSPAGIYTPSALGYLLELSERLQQLPNVDSDNTLSLATATRISGDAYGIEVVPVLEEVPATLEAAQQLRTQVEDFPLFMGTLAGRDGRAALIVAQLLDESLAEASYRSVLELLAQYPPPTGLVAHVAGEGAIAGYLGAYIDADAQRLNPLAGAIIVGIIILAFRRVLPAVLSVGIILASVGAALGSMAAAGIPFYVITNALPVILIGIAVADTIHVFNHFYALQVADPRVPREERIVETMSDMWLPVTITSLTTAAGFLGLYLAAYMPPFKFFGLYAALGVGAAWLYSMVALPALMKLGRAQVAESRIHQHRRGGMDLLGRLMQRIGQFTLQYPKSVLLAFVLLAMGGALAASQLVVDADRIRLFHPEEPIVKADQAINRYLNGTNTLDIVVETGAAEGLFDPQVLARIEALQNYALTLPHVRGASSIVDYLKQMNRVLNSGEAADYRLPDSREAVAQYFLLYSFSADPADFEEEVDYDYRVANVRITMNHGGYRQIKAVYESLDSWVAEHFDDQVSATLSGRVSLNYHWIRNIGDSHFFGLAIALLLVWLVASLSFGSLLAGVFTLIPVVVSVLIVYAFMVLRGLTLGVGTSMFAAVAIGLGVDFAIHTLSRLRALHREYEGDEAMFDAFFSSTGKALLLNVLAVACGFGVLIFSKVTQLSDFGSIVMLSMAVSFLASVTLLPAIVHLTRPRFLGGPGVGSGAAGAAGGVAGLLVLAMVVASHAPPLRAQEQAQEQNPAQEQPASVMEASALTADEVVAGVNAVPQGEQVTRKLLFKTTDKRGKSRERDTISYRRYFGEERRLALFFTAPANIRDTGVLTWDYADPAQDDDQWLYLPALRKARRIPAGDRGDYFLGTDFSFEDMKLDGQLSVGDYDYLLVDAESDTATGSGPDLASGVIAGAEPGQLILEATPKSAEIAEELGYSRNRIAVDPVNWIVRSVDFWDLRGVHLKTLRADDIRKIDDIWTRHTLHMHNHRTGHSTEISVSDVDYLTPIEARVFTQQALKRGG
ncbi:MAG: putative RND superfamily exporter protein [Halieaceae bacterium]